MGNRKSQIAKRKKPKFIYKKSLYSIKLVRFGTQPYESVQSCTVRYSPVHTGSGWYRLERSQMGRSVDAEVQFVVAQVDVAVHAGQPAVMIFDVLVEVRDLPPRRNDVIAAGVRKPSEADVRPSRPARLGVDAKMRLGRRRGNPPLVIPHIHGGDLVSIGSRGKYLHQAQAVGEVLTLPSLPYRRRRRRHTLR